MKLYLVTVTNSGLSDFIYDFYVVATDFLSAESKVMKGLKETNLRGKVTNIKLITEEAKDYKNEPYFSSDEKRLVI